MMPSHKAQAGFTLVEFSVMLLGASLIALAVVALIMPLHRQVLQQLAWSELSQQGRVMTSVLRRLGQCSSVLSAEHKKVVLGVDARCAAEHGLGLGLGSNIEANIIHGWAGGRGEIGGSPNSVIPVLIESRDLQSGEVGSINVSEGERYGLYIKIGQNAAREWVRGVELVQLRYELCVVDDLKREICDFRSAKHIQRGALVRTIRLITRLNSSFGQAESWNFLVNLRESSAARGLHLS